MLLTRPFRLMPMLQKDELVDLSLQAVVFIEESPLWLIFQSLLIQMLLDCELWDLNLLVASSADRFLPNLDRLFVVQDPHEPDPPSRSSGYNSVIKSKQTRESIELD
jgi:hypothetical protein